MFSVIMPSSSGKFLANITSLESTRAWGKLGIESGTKLWVPPLSAAWWNRGDTPMHTELSDNAPSIYAQRTGGSYDKAGVETLGEERRMAALLQARRLHTCTRSCEHGHHSQTSFTLFCWCSQTHHPGFCENREQTRESQCTLLLVSSSSHLFSFSSIACFYACRVP